MRKLSTVLVIMMVLTVVSYGTVNGGVSSLNVDDVQQDWSPEMIPKMFGDYELVSKEIVDGNTVTVLSDRYGEQIIFEEIEIDCGQRFLVTENGIEMDYIINNQTQEIFLNNELLATIEEVIEPAFSNVMSAGIPVVPQANGVVYTTNAPLQGTVNDYTGGTYKVYTVKFTQFMVNLTASIFVTTISICVFPLTWGGAITAGAVGVAYGSIANWFDWLKIKTPSADSVKYRAYVVPWNKNGTGSGSVMAFKHYCKFYTVTGIAVPNGETNAKYQTIVV